MIVSKIGLCERMTSSSTTKIPWGLKDGFLKAQVLLLKNMCCIYVLYCWLESYHTLLKGFGQFYEYSFGKRNYFDRKNSIALVIEAINHTELEIQVLTSKLCKNAVIIAFTLEVL